MNKILSKTPKLQLGKAFLTLLFGVFALFANIDATKAQTTVQVGTGTSTSYRLPINTYYGYNYSQQIYTGTEIAAAGGSTGTITQIKFYLSSLSTPLSNWSDWTVYLGNTTTSSFASNSSWIPLTSLTQVFTGTITAASSSWVTLTLSTPFNYTGGNLVVAVDENSPSYAGSSYWRSFSSAAPTGKRSLVYYNDYTNPSPATPPTANYSSSSLRAQIQLSIAPPPPPCSGTPTPGNTTASSASVIMGQTVNFGLQNSTAGTGVTYQWQTGPSSNGPWTPISGATLSSLTNYAPSATAWYSCVVNCTASSSIATSTPVQVTYTPVCLPTYTSGTSYGDQIANVAITGPGLTWNNNSGATSGTPSYVSYTGMPPVVMQAATTYTMTVTAGNYGNQAVAVWIDANDNNIFETSEKVGFTTTNISTGGGTISFNINLPCTPPLGIHRMRVRDVYNGSGSSMDPCSNYSYGETEDYLVQFVAGTPFTPTFTVSPTTQSCTYVDYTYTTQANQQNYAWSIPGTANVDYQLVSGGTATSNTAVIKWLVGGFKTVTVDYQNLSGCNSTGPVSNTITVQQTVQVASSTGANDVCAGSTVTMANPTANGTWSSANTAVATVDATTGVVTGVGAGNTNIVYSVANPNTWCAATTNLKPIIVKPTPVVNAGADVTLCAGNSTNFNATVNYSLTHTIQLTDTFGDGWNGCSVTVSVNGTPVLVGITLLSGFGPESFEFNAPIGASIDVDFTAGSYASETRITVINGAGTNLVSNFAIGSAGSWSGTAGPALLNTWSPISGLSGTTILNPVATPNSTTTYTLSSTAPNGCIGTDQVVVTVNPLPSNGPVIAPAELCAGTSATVSNSVPNGVWTTSTPTLLSLNPATGEVTGIAAGTATLSYTTTAANGCTKTNSANITINPLPVAVISSSNGATICQGTSTVLSAPTAAAYSWNNGSAASSLTISNGGTYSVVLTSAAGCISAPSAPYTVTVNQLPVANVSVSGPTVFCAGGSVTLTASGGATYSWSNSATTAALNATQSGSYIATVTSAQGCSVTTPSVNVTVNPLPVANIVASGPLTYCQGGSFNLTATGIGSYQWSNGSSAAILPITTSGSYSYTITNAAGCSATSTAAVVQINPVPTVTSVLGNNAVCMGSNTTYTNATTGGVWSSANPNIASVNAAGEINGLQAGSSTINYTVTNSFGCSTIASKTIVVNPVPSAITQVNGNTTFCTGGSVTLVAPPADNYLWSNSATTQNITVNTSGNYSVTASLSGCTGTSIPVTVTVNALPSTTITSSATALCPGATATLSVPTAATYLWSNGAITPSIATATPGSYSVTVTNAAGCTATSAPVAITAATVPTVSVTPNGPVAFCAGGNVVLNSTASAGTTYLWSNGSTTPNITATASGVYFVTVTNAAGCQASSNNIVVNAQQTFTASATALSPTTVCAGTPVTLVASPGSSYLWSNGATTQGVNVTAGGPITVTVTNASGCTGTSTPISVTVLPVPNATINAGGPLTFCQGGSVNLTATGGASYNWSTGANTAALAATTSGNYVVTVTAANGCTDTEQATVTVNAVPSANVVMDGNSVLCPGETLTLAAAPGNTYAWTTGASTSEITVSTAGTYGVTVTSSNGCSANSGNIIISSGQSTSSTLDVTALDAYILNGVEYTTPGTYTQVIQNEAGCDSTITLNLTLTVGIDDLNAVVYEVYPNPTADQFTIDASQAVNGAFSIQDAQGKIVKEGLMTGVSTTVDINEVARGIYFLRIAESPEAIRIIKN
jgi:large repetitive protein